MWDFTEISIEVMHTALYAPLFLVGSVALCLLLRRAQKVLDGRIYARSDITSRDLEDPKWDRRTWMLKASSGLMLLEVIMASAAGMYALVFFVFAAGAAVLNMIGSVI